MLQCPFFLGRRSQNPCDPDYVPTKFPHIKTSERSFKQRQDRYERISKRRKNLQDLDASLDLDGSLDLGEVSLDLDIPLMDVEQPPTIDGMYSYCLLLLYVKR